MTTSRVGDLEFLLDEGGRIVDDSIVDHRYDTGWRVSYCMACPKPEGISPICERPECLRGGCCRKPR